MVSSTCSLPHILLRCVYCNIYVSHIVGRHRDLWSPHAAEPPTSKAEIASGVISGLKWSDVPALAGGTLRQMVPQILLCMPP